MPIASTTNHLAPPRRAHPRHIVGALLLAIGLTAVAITITITSTTSTASRLTARPATINPRSHPTVEPTGVSDTNLAGGTFHDPVTHAPLAAGILPAHTPSPASAIDKPKTEPSDREGHLEAVMIGGRWLIRADAVDAWFDSKRVAPPTPRRERSFAPRRNTTAERDGWGSVARLKMIEGSSGG